VTVRDRPSRHQVPGGRIMRAKNALISGEASWPSEIVQRHRDGKRIGLVGRCGFRFADQSIKSSGPSGMMPLWRLRGRGRNARLNPSQFL
jgi:hypothetical protein